MGGGGGVAGAVRRHFLAKDAESPGAAEEDRKIRQEDVSLAESAGGAEVEGSGYLFFFFVCLVISARCFCFGGCILDRSPLHGSFEPGMIFFRYSLHGRHRMPSISRRSFPR